MVSPFILPACLSIWLVNEKARNRWRGVDELYGFTYYVMLINSQIHVYLIPSFVKNIEKYYQAHCCRVQIQVSQDGFSHFETYMCVLGLWCANTADAIKWVRWLEDRFIMHRFMSWLSYRNSMLEQIDLHARFSTCNLPITVASLC